MKGRIIASLLLMSTCFSCRAEIVDSAFYASLGLPLLSIYTVNEEMPTCDYVWPPEGAFGISTTNKNKVPGRIIFSDKGKIIYDSGEYEKDQSGMNIHIRGNTSAYFSAKKPYKIKLEKKNDLFGRNDNRFYDKNWILIDEGGGRLKTIVGLKLNELFGLGGWTPEYRFVNLFFNGKYHGIYMLLESIKRNADCRLNVHKNSGYIIERDAYWWNEDLYFSTPMKMQYTFKYPDSKDITNEQLNYIQTAVENMETSISDGTYNEHIDIKSFARWVLAHDILGTYDSGGSNIYVTKYDSTANSKFTMATLWDFDSSFRVTDNWARVHYDFFYFKQLFDNSNHLFLSAYKHEWEQMRDSIFNAMNKFFDDFLDSPLTQALNRSRSMDGAVWKYHAPTVKSNIDEYRSWMEQRREWLDENIMDIDVEPYDILQIASQTQHNSLSPATVYNISGQKMSSSHSLRKGIYIRDGRKYIVR